MFRNRTQWWRLKCVDGKEKRISLGAYPETILKQARAQREDARKLLTNGIDPSANRKAIKITLAEQNNNTFEIIAREWHKKYSPNWVSSHSDKIIRRLKRDIFPYLGAELISNITAPKLLKILRRIEECTAIETAHRALQNCSQIFRYAIETGRTERDPAPDLSGALSSIKSTHIAAITQSEKIGELLRAIDSYKGAFVMECALKFAPLVFVRPGELRTAQWTEINLEKSEWNISAERMKMRQPLLGPLSKQAVTILRELYAVTGNERYVFPSARSNTRPMSENAILAALRRMRFTKEEMTGHSFRAMARTVLGEVLGVRPDFIEHQLGYAVRDPNGRAYNRTAHLAERKKMMQMWGDYLENLKKSLKL